MKLNRYIFLTVTIMVTFLTQSMVFAQVNLTDVSGHWGKKEIEEMVEKKFILGYPDGTFKPDKEVTKLDTLIIAARVLGVDKEANREEVIAAEDAYSDLLSSYNIYGKREISFLLNRKVLIDSDLDTYLKGDNAKAFTKRYEAAVIFTKILGKESEVKNKTYVFLSFMDSNEIPQDAKPFVQYMNEQGIMNGVSKTEFKPNLPLTRAQIAIMLLRVSNKLEPGSSQDPTGYETTMSGKITYIDQTNRMIIVGNSTTTKTFSLLPSTPVKVDNSTSDLSVLEKGFDVVVRSSSSQTVLEVSATSRTYSTTVSGVISDIVRSPSVKIGIRQGVDKDLPVNDYGADEYIHITRNGIVTSIDKVEEDDYATVYILSNGKIGKIAAEDKDKIVSGVVDNLTIDDKVYLTLKIDEKSTKYEVLSDVTVSRNGSDSSLKDVKSGDRATIKLRYNQVKDIKAESDRKTIEGTIEEIFISKSPKLTVKTGSKTTTYDMASNAAIKVDKLTSAIYDLRLGYRAEFKIDNNVIVGVDAEKKIETMEVRGLIKVINLNLGLITVASEDDDSIQTQIYVDRSTKVNNVIESKTLKPDDLDEGDRIIAYGRNDRGVFVTSLIVVMSEE